MPIINRFVRHMTAGGIVVTLATIPACSQTSSTPDGAGDAPRYQAKLEASDPANRLEQFVGQQLDLYKKDIKQSFNVDDTSKDAVLQMIFEVKDWGFCPQTYEPTEIVINGKPVLEMNFRDDYNRTARYKETFSIPKKYLVKGTNTMQIHAGFCGQGGRDVMVITDAVIEQG